MTATAPTNTTVGTTTAPRSPHVLFICWGNICRSPMAERVARAHGSQQGLDVRFSSAGLSAEEEGHHMDRRAQKLLTSAGYDAEGHVAHKVTAEELREADLVVVAEDFHRDRILRSVPDADHIRLITDFDPAAAPGQGLPDPWYGDLRDFGDTLDAIEAAMPGLMAEVRQLAS